MNQSYNQMFAEKEILEENKYQTVLLGHKQDDPEHRVLIHKFKKDERFNAAFMGMLESLQNALHIEEDDAYIILVSKYLEGDNISLHLNFSHVNDVERLDYLYEYLHQAVAYIGFDNYLFNNLISANQVVFIDQKLRLREQIILDRRFNDELPFSMISKNIGQVMQRILITNYNELRTSKKYDDLHRFTESLIRREKDYQCFDDLFNDFKLIYFTKSFSKRRVLLGDKHPNNMYLEQSQEAPFIPEPMEEEFEAPVNQGPTPQTFVSEVTEEERAILTGPIEESIDLSRLSDKISSFDELLVKEVSEEAQEEEKPEAKETPVYGVPAYMKEEHHEEPKKRKQINFNWLAPAIILCLVAVLVFVGIKVIQLFDEEEVIAQRPTAQFTATIEDGALVCKNTSVAYNDEIIVEGLWVISKDGKELLNKSTSNLTGIRANDLQEGVYTIKLTVTDSAGQFSDPVIQEKEYLSPESKAKENQLMSEARLSTTKASDSTDTSVERMDLFDIGVTENVSIDDTIFHEGNKSYKLDLSQGLASISFNDLEIAPASTISFWIMTNKSENIVVNIAGYNNGFNNYNHNVTTTITDVLSWKVASVQLSTKEATDNIIITFPEKDMIVWFDDLSIRTFK